MFQLANGAKGSLGTLEFEYLDGSKGSFDDLNLDFDYFRVAPTLLTTETKTWMIDIETWMVGTKSTTEAETETPPKQEPETTENKDVE